MSNTPSQTNLENTWKLADAHCLALPDGPQKDKAKNHIGQAATALFQADEYPEADRHHFLNTAQQHIFQAQKIIKAAALSE